MIGGNTKKNKIGYLHPVESDQVFVFISFFYIKTRFKFFKILSIGSFWAVDLYNWHPTWDNSFNPTKAVDVSLKPNPFQILRLHVSFIVGKKNPKVQKY